MRRSPRRACSGRRSRPGCRRNGIAAQLVIGCRPLPFESHAWVEVDGRVVNDLLNTSGLSPCSIGRDGPVMRTHAGAFFFDGHQVPTTDGWDHREPFVSMTQSGRDLWLSADRRPP